MSNSNPYKAPDAPLAKEEKPRKNHRIARILLGIFGLYLLIGRGEMGGSAAYHQGQVFARVLGAGILLLAVFPFGKPPLRGKSDLLDEL